MILASFRLAAMAAGLAALLPLHYLWKLAGRPSPWPRRFLAWCGRAAGMRVQIGGTPLDRHVLFVANHESWLDILLIAGATGSAFVSKEEIARTPVVGWLASLNNTLYVARSSRAAAADQVEVLREALAREQPVTLFPEGTIGDGPELLPFRASLFAALLPPRPGVRLQPIAVDYGLAAREITWTGDEPAFSNALRVLSRRGTVLVTLRFLAPIDPAAAPDRKTLAQRSRDAIVGALAASAPLTDPL